MFPRQRSAVSFSGCWRCHLVPLGLFQAQYAVGRAMKPFYHKSCGIRSASSKTADISHSLLRKSCCNLLDKERIFISPPFPVQIHCLLQIWLYHNCTFLQGEEEALGYRRCWSYPLTACWVKQMQPRDDVGHNSDFPGFSILADLRIGHCGFSQK